jgi:hypothetical protein
MSDGDFENLDAGTPFHYLEIEGSDELQDLNGHIFVPEHDCCRQRVYSRSAPTPKVVFACVRHRVQSVMSEAVV